MNFAQVFGVKLGLSGGRDEMERHPAGFPIDRD
jgi:hypothetical protein